MWFLNSLISMMNSYVILIRPKVKSSALKKFPNTECVVFHFGVLCVLDYACS